MAEDIVTQLEWLHSEFYDVDSVTSIVELAKAEIERLRAERDAIDTLHHPVPSGKDDEVCNNCGCFWPCTTHSLLHPKEARRE